MANRRRNSYVEIAVNPLENATNSNDILEQKIELVSTSIPIDSGQFTEILAQIQLQRFVGNVFLPNVCSDSSEILKILSTQKNGFLFRSDDLIQILDCIPSKKTQIAVIEMIGPRLTDPKKCSTELLSRFRFAEEKQIVQDILKARSVTQNSNVYASRKPLGGIGGRHSPKKKMNQAHVIQNQVATNVELQPVITQEIGEAASSTCVLSTQDLKFSQTDVPLLHKHDEVPNKGISIYSDNDTSPVTTNEDLENMIVDRDEIKLESTLHIEPTASEVSTKETILLDHIPGEVLSGLKYDGVKDGNQESKRESPVEQYQDAPIIDLVGTRTRLLSLHQPVARPGSESEFLTQTDEFSFDERFQTSIAQVNEKTGDSSGNKKLLYC